MHMKLSEKLQFYSEHPKSSNR